MTLIINGEEIEAGLVEQEFAGIKASYEQISPYNCCCDRDDEFRGYARQNIIARVLLTQEALRRYPTPTEQELDQALARVVAEHGGEEAFYAAIGATPQNLPQIRQELAVNTRVQKLIDEACAEDGPLTDQELRDYYQQHLDRYMTVERVRASHILKSPPRGEDREPTYRLMRDLRRQLLEGANFRSLAQEHSDKVKELDEMTPEQRETVGDGIDLGFFRRGELMDEFETVAFSLGIGEISPVFATAFGYHLAIVTEREDSRPIPFDEVRDTVHQQCIQAHREKRVQKLVEQLKAKAIIEGDQPEVQECEHDDAAASP